MVNIVVQYLTDLGKDTGLKVCHFNLSHSAILTRKGFQMIKIHCHDHVLMSIDGAFEIMGPVCKSLGLSIEECSNEELGTSWGIDYNACVAVFGLLAFEQFISICARGYKRIMDHFSIENLCEICLILISYSFFHFWGTNLIASIHLAAWMVFVAWMNFTLYLGRLETIGQFIFMSLDIAVILMLYLLTGLFIFQLNKTKISFLTWVSALAARLVAKRASQLITLLIG